ncbi:MAG: hypothetical protein PUB86_06150 [Elusimicrobia bacterium]|nr:hypothetical protein [Elusimicrobiota bacterium]
MKKFLLVLSCFVFAVCAKAAEYEISTALSSPYGMFSTFSVFGDATVKDLIIGAESVNNTTPTGFGSKVYRPIQETYLEAGSISFGGNIKVERDLFLESPNQTYNNILVTRYSSNTIQQNTLFDMNFTTIEIPTLYAGTLVTGPLSLPYPAVVTNLYTASFTVRNGSSSFIFPPVRGVDLGYKVFPASISNCGEGNDGHYYGAWRTCTGGSCSADTCNGDEIESYECPRPDDPNKVVKSKNCTDKREVTYEPSDIINKPYVSDIKVYYRKCVYENNIEDTGAIQCVMENFASGEDVFYNNLGDLEQCSVSNDPSESDIESCLSLCSKYSGGCETVERACYMKNETAFGPNCAASGWEMGSGLECTDSYTRALYTIYTCPAGSDYIHRPDTGNSGRLKFSQYRDVACAGQNVENNNKSDAYCGTNFLTVDF